MSATPLEPDPQHDTDPPEEPNEWGDPTAPPSPGGPPGEDVRGGPAAPRDEDGELGTTRPPFVTTHDDATSEEDA